jgi:hypothetical protein
MIRAAGTIQKPGNNGKPILLRQGARSFECFRPGAGQNGGGADRGKITGAQSRKSRKRQMCDLLEWKDGPQAWQTVGFPEEDMLGMAIRERSLHGQEVKHRFEKHLKKNLGNRIQMEKRMESPSKWGLYRRILSSLSSNVSYS